MDLQLHKYEPCVLAQVVVVVLHEWELLEHSSLSVRTHIGISVSNFHQGHGYPLEMLRTRI